MCLKISLGICSGVRLEIFAGITPRIWDAPRDSPRHLLWDASRALLGISLRVKDAFTDLPRHLLWDVPRDLPRHFPQGLGCA